MNIPISTFKNFLNPIIESAGIKWNHISGVQVNSWSLTITYYPVDAQYEHYLNEAGDAVQTRDVVIPFDLNK